MLFKNTPEPSLSDPFQLHSDFAPAGEQPQAIAALIAGFRAGEAHQVLLGVTGSGKTFTIANVIQQTGRPGQGHRAKVLLNAAVESNGARLRLVSFPRAGQPAFPA